MKAQVYIFVPYFLQMIGQLEHFLKTLTVLATSIVANFGGILHNFNYCDYLNFMRVDSLQM